MKERHGSSWTAGHGTIVCACPDCRGAQRGAGGQTHSHLRPEPEPDTWPSTVQDHRRASPCPARWTATPTRSSRSTGTGPPIIYGTAPSTQSRRHLGAPRGRREALGPGRPATAYMAARASEHLTADPARSSREPVTQRPRSPPTSDPRGTRAEGTAQFAHRHRMDPQGSPVTLRKPMAARRAAPKSHQKATEGSPAHPRDPRTETPAQLALSPATAQVRMQRPNDTH